MFYIYSGNAGSQGAKRLAEALKIRRVKHVRSRVVAKATDTVICWGASDLPANLARAKLLNKPADKEVVSNKLAFFEAMKDAREVENGRQRQRAITPKHFTSREEATAFMRRNGGSMVCRTILNGSGGAGIVIADGEDQLVNAPLYVRYINKKEEFRCHFVNKKCIDVQRKARRLEDNDVDWRIRNHDNGFNFVRGNIVIPPCGLEVAQVCMNHLQIDFGAVDVIWNAQNNRAYVLEVNSAPGLEGQTVEKYAQAFTEEYKK